MHKINKPRRELSLNEAAEKSASSRTAFQRLSVLLQENLKECPSLETRPSPSDNPKDPLNLAIQCLQALRTSLDHGLLELINSQAASHLLVQLYPSITSWIEYCIHHIVIPDRTHQFQFFSLQSLLSSIITHYCAEPVLYPSSPPQDLGVYMPNFIPLLFHTHHLACPQVQYDMLSDLFKSLLCFMHLDSKLDWDAEPMWRTELYGAVICNVESIVSAYIVVATTLLDVFRLVDTQKSADDWLKRLHRVHAVVLIIRGPKYSQQGNDMITKLYERGYFRLIFQSLSFMASSKLLRRLVVGIQSPAADHTITNIWDCLCVMVNTLPDNPGLPIIQLGYDEQFLPSLFKLDRLVAHSCASSEMIRDSHEDIIAKSVHHFMKYLVYYSTYKFARKTCLQIMQSNMLLGGQLGGVWKSYLDRVGDLEKDYETYRTNPPAICDAENCPNRETTPDKLMGCAGCGKRFLYCSRACQRNDWLAGHREKCLEIRRSAKRRNGYPDAAYSRDLHFLQTLLQQYIAEFRNENPAMVRVVDCTQPNVEAKLVCPEQYRGKEPNLDNMIAFAKVGGGVMVHMLIPSDLETKIEIMDDTGCRPVYNPHSTNCPD